MTTANIDKGYGFDASWTIAAADGEPEDLAGASVVWKIARTKEASEPLLTKTLSLSGSEATLSLSGVETETLEPGSHYHQLSVALSGGTPKIYFSGFITVIDRL